jgi:hypothetical protein
VWAHVLRRLRYLGRKRAHGHGRILGVEVERIEEDRSLIWQGRAMRWRPDPSGGGLTAQVVRRIMLTVSMTLTPLPAEGSRQTPRLRRPIQETYSAGDEWAGEIR